MYKLVQEPPCVFSGDHLFICGNGKCFVKVGMVSALLNKESCELLSDIRSDV